MVHRSHLSPKERSARSRLTQLIQSQSLLHGSLVSMSRSCGKKGCKCTRGEKHLSLYLSVRVGKNRKMIYLPPRCEEQVRSWVEAYREAEQLIEQISQACMERLLRQKQEGKKE